MTIDSKTIKRFKEGDAEAFDLIYLHYRKKLYLFALKLVKNKETAEDLLQEVFVNLWEKRSQVDLSLNFDNYIFTVTYNSTRKYFRRKSLEDKIVDYLVKTSPEISETTESTLIYNELLEIATRAIEKLPPRRKAVYKMSRQEGLKIKEIAEKMNISKNTAEVHLTKALKFLKQELSQIPILSLLFYYLFIY